MLNSILPNLYITWMPWSVVHHSLRQCALFHLHGLGNSSAAELNGGKVCSSSKGHLSGRISSYFEWVVIAESYQNNQQQYAGKHTRAAFLAPFVPHTDLFTPPVVTVRRQDLFPQFQSRIHLTSPTNTHWPPAPPRSGSASLLNQCHKFLTRVSNL